MTELKIKKQNSEEIVIDIFIRYVDKLFQYETQNSMKFSNEEFENIILNEKLFSKKNELNLEKEKLLKKLDSFFNLKKEDKNIYSKNKENSRYIGILDYFKNYNNDILTIFEVNRS